MSNDTKDARTLEQELAEEFSAFAEAWLKRAAATKGTFINCVGDVKNAVHHMRRHVRPAEVRP
ncbi:MAG: hypothetical protein IT371_09985 [Deltaproteobacteria bacterium]|nr:hypothetical protein [Deltaproteobacteria bacterium]